VAFTSAAAVFNSLVASSFSIKPFEFRRTLALIARDAFGVIPLFHSPPFQSFR